jgi:hypothetical protein
VASASGGAGGEQAGAGGAATATASASAPGFSVEAVATARGGAGATGELAGAASAAASATGASGLVSANVLSQVSGSTALETEITASGQADVNGSANGYAQTGFAGALPAFQDTGAAVAYGMADPSAAAVNAVFKANPTIAAAFGDSPDVYELGEIGGAHATAGPDSETSIANEIVYLNTANLAGDQDLAVGFYDGDSAAASGVTGVLLNVTDNGQTLVHESVTSDAAARTFFSDNVLSGLKLLSPGGGLAELSLSLTVYSDGANSGFYGDFVIGGVPQGTALNRTSG